MAHQTTISYLRLSYREGAWLENLGDDEDCVALGPLTSNDDEILGRASVLDWWSERPENRDAEKIIAFVQENQRRLTYPGLRTLHAMILRLLFGEAGDEGKAVAESVFRRDIAHWNPQRPSTSLIDLMNLRQKQALTLAGRVKQDGSRFEPRGLDELRKHHLDLPPKRWALIFGNTATAEMMMEYVDVNRAKLAEDADGIRELQDCCVEFGDVRSDPGSTPNFRNATWGALHRHLSIIRDTVMITIDDADE